MTEEPGDATLLETSARSLARRHVATGLTAGRGSVRRRVAALERRLGEVLGRLVQTGDLVRGSRAAEWILDNDYLVRSSLEQVRQGMPRSYYGELPKLGGGPLHGEARSYAVARFVVESEVTDQVDPERVQTLLRTYQTIAPLSSGELWALPTFARLVLLEDLVSLADRLFAGPQPTVESTSGSAPEDEPATAERIGMCIRSLRILDTHDWRAFFESVSRVERALRLDPAGVYGRMDFETRDRYRGMVEEMARRAGVSEGKVALEAVRLARSRRHRHPGEGHLGWFLLGPGKAALEDALGGQGSRALRLLSRWVQRRSTILYLGSLTVVAAGALTLLTVPTWDTSGRWIAFAAVLALIPASEVAVSLVNWLLTLFVSPRRLPKMDFDLGIPGDARTVVVVPCLLSSAEEVLDLLGQLELTYLGNEEPNLCFALLSDFPDAPREVMPGDREVLDRAIRGIRTLNERYGRDPDRGPFLLLHRSRLWNPSEGCWMAWERKRGKLEEFNELLRDGTGSAFVTREGDLSRFEGIRYVLTLDADTSLPPGGARRLIGALAHPLNRPRYDESRRVVEGYTVLQPRVEIGPAAESDTMFSRIFGHRHGLDLYSHAVSDVYQDVFGEGIYVGKGIYDVAAFRRSLHGRVPENALLSHDLFEGVHGRAGLVSDVVVFEDFPTHVVAHSRRLHRWTRGDWQILPWLLPRVPTASGRSVPNRLSLLSRWKIADNLRRSLFRAALLALLLAGWTALPGGGVWWTTVALVILALPMLQGMPSVARRRLGSHATWTWPREGPRSRGTGFVQWALLLTLLPYHALTELDAIARTLLRLSVTRRHLLQWKTAAYTARYVREADSRLGIWSRMFPASVLGAAAAGAVWMVRPGALPAALPVLALWVISPAVAHWVSRRRPAPAELLNEEDEWSLRKLARRTWAYFEDHVGPGDHWLPPDHFQEYPGEKVVRRTSPTNIGLLAASILAAYDLGYLGLDEVRAWLENLLDTLEGMERHRGHLLNWYDTRDLAPLAPFYVSTVDSGNLAACLVAVAQGLRGLADAPAFEERRARGLCDGLGVLLDLVGSMPGSTERRGRGLTARLAELIDAVRRVGVIPRDWKEFLEDVRARSLPEIEAELAAVIEGRPAPDAARVSELRGWLTRLHGQVSAAHREVEGLVDDPAARAELRRALLELADRSDALVKSMEFGFLFDRERGLFHIGYNLSSEQLDGSYYDLLASEARLTSFLAISRGQVPARHWLRLGRPFARAGRRTLVLSWGGSAFEYLMPLLLQQTPRGSLMEWACREAVASQIRYGKQQRVPWGVSESSFYHLDAHANYQYRAFGVPEMGLKRGLGDRVVISPYASILALGVRPRAVMANLQRLEGEGALGALGLYEALDYGAPVGRGTPAPRVVRSYMAHHQGMILLALDNRLHEQIMVERFHADPRVSAAEILLHEGIPGRVRLVPRPTPVAEPVPAHRRAPLERWTALSEGAHPQVHVLSNGTFSLLAAADGGGGLRLRGHDLTRWRPDPTVRTWGTWVYVRDGETGEHWSATAAPVAAAPHPRETHFAPHMVEYHGEAHGISSRTTVTVPPSADVELRRLVLRNQTERPRDLTVSSYGEVVLADPPDDRRHPAFSKLFVEAMVQPRRNTLLFRRRPRAPEDPSLVLAHAVVGSRLEAGPPLSFAIERGRFIGRPGTLKDPAGIEPGRREANVTGTLPEAPLSIGEPSSGARGDSDDGQSTAPPESTGSWVAPLDPVFSLSVPMRLGPRQEAELVFVTAAGTTVGRVLQELDQYRSPARVEWAVEEAAIRCQVELQSLEIPPRDEAWMQRLFSAMVHPYHVGRRGELALEGSVHGQEVLWSLGVSGDHPVLLVIAAHPVDRRPVLRLLRWHALWQRRGIVVDLVVLDEGAQGYEQPLLEFLHRTVPRLGTRRGMGVRGGVHHVPVGRLDPAARWVLEATASVTLRTDGPDLERQIGSLAEAPVDLPPFTPIPSTPLPLEPTPPLAPLEPLQPDNGLGGFTGDGREYVLRIGPGQITPTPWVNVVATQDFGFIASEGGGGFTWAGNSGESRLTPWANDPVLDTPGEAIYVRDEETGELCTPTPSPVGSGGPHRVRHGIGYSTFLHRWRGLEQILLLSAAREDPVKLLRLEIRNLGARPRRLTVTCFAEWVLGNRRDVTAPHLLTEYEAETGVLLARNRFSRPEGPGIAFLASSEAVHGSTCDRHEFIGPRGDLGRPAGLERIGLAGRSGAGYDPCAALQVHVDLPSGGVRTVFFFLGAAEDRETALSLVKRYRGPGVAERATVDTRAWWDEILDRIQVRTPERAMDLVLNRWLLYQALSCRLWGRSALYQSSGAYGFRDQLQDALAFLATSPEMALAQVLDAARHQFSDGDVLHWWHPRSGRGVRTRCSDDLVWLPYVVSEYVRASGDRGVLSVEVPFLEGPPLQEGEVERYAEYPTGPRSGSVEEHCLRALERAATEGEDGLPLMGSGDWNDGMNRVGAKMRGQSVWLGWFLYATIRRFVPLVSTGNRARGAALTDRAERYRVRLEAVAWDGDWYLRGTYDDGSPLGSAGNRECRIDSLTQSWAVLSGGARPDRARRAMRSVMEHLVRREDGIVLLLAPPFDETDQDPGYIKAYPPGVRENGGQYTHAATWVGWALAALGDGDGAADVFRMLNPVEKTGSPESVARYRVEPYVVAADVYTGPGRTGRGGWTWYTGSAGWLYRLGIEAILGFRRMADGIRLDPCIPRTWSGYELLYRAPDATYHIRVENPEGVCRGVSAIVVDGEVLEDAVVPLLGDGEEHEVRVRMGTGVTPLVEAP